MDVQKPIHIDVAAVLRSRLGERYSYVPSFLVRRIEKLICQDGLNSLLENNFPKRGAEFCDGVLDELDVRLEVRGEENLPDNPRIIIACNHPLGGLDGMGMIAWAGRHYGRPVHFVVNDLLMAVEPLRDCFVPINKHGRQSRAAAGSLDEALAGDDPVLIYPAGLCSRLQPDGSIADLKWNKMFINKAIESRRDIVPVFFDGQNSNSFYRTAKWRQRLGIKFNFEMVLLPREIFRAKGSTFRLTVGKPVSWQSLSGGSEAMREAQQMRSLVYGLKQTPQ